MTGDNDLPKTLSTDEGSRRRTVLIGLVSLFLVTSMVPAVSVSEQVQTQNVNDIGEEKKVKKAPDEEWNKTFGEESNFSAVLGVFNSSESDGYTAFGTTSNRNSGLPWKLDLTTDGTLTNKRLYNQLKNYSVDDVIKTSDSGYLLLTTRGGINEELDTRLVKLSPSGDIKWQKTYGENDVAQGQNVFETPNGYVFARTTKVNSSNKLNVTKVDDSGRILWSKVYDINSFSYRIKKTSDGGFLIHTDVTQNRDYVPIVVKVDSDGDIQWNKSYGGSQSRQIAEVVETSDGYVMVGLTRDKNVKSDGWLLEVDKNGNVRTTKTFGTDSENESISRIIKGSNGGYVLGATIGWGKTLFPEIDASSWLIKTDGSYGISWEKTVDGRGAILSLRRSQDGYLISGFDTVSKGKNFKTNGFVAKYGNGTDDGGGGDGNTTEIVKLISNLKSQNNIVNFSELQQAISIWISDGEIPGTNKKIDFNDLQTAISYWIQEKVVE